MDNLSPHPQYKQTGFFALWAVSVVLSIVFYADSIGDLFNSTKDKMCSTANLWDALQAFVQPANWFGIFTIAISIIGIQVVYKAARSRWNMLEHYRTLALVTLAAGILIFFSAKCG